jgi:YHS domain-containing protein/thiol-disulfide isomerase/thioredoxin
MRATCIAPAIILLAFAGSAVAADGIAWQQNLETAKRRSAETNRPILIHFWAPSCAPCVRLDSEVFPQPAVAQAINSNFIPVKLNTDDFPATASLYGVDRIPMDVVLSPAGQLVYRAKSPLVADQFVAHVSQAARGGAMPPVQLAADANAEQAGGGTVPINPGGQLLPQSGGQFASSPINAATPPSGVNVAAQGPSWPQSAPHHAAVQQPSNQPQVQAQPMERQHISFTPNSHAIKMPATAQTSSPLVQQVTPWVGQPTQNAQAGGAPPVVGPAYVPVTSATGPAATQPFATPITGPSSNTMAGTVQPQAAEQRQPVMIPAKEAPPVGLDGFCPVTLAEQKKWVRGDVRYGVEHRGRTYLFCTPENQKKFFDSPDRYSPVMCGMDPVLQLEARQTTSGRRDLGVFYQNRVYLFATVESKAAFEKQPQKYAAEVLAAEATTGRVMR